ncbi:MDR family MFS transporter [Rhodococcus sp. NPDC004095]
MTDTAESTTVAAESGGDGVFTHRQILAVLSGLMISMFLASLDQTVVSTAIRTIADDLDGYALQAWATTAYLVTATLVTPLYGKLSDMYGRKPFYLAAIIIFVVGSLMCAASQSMYMLAVFRAIQGIGAGGLVSLALAILGDIVGPRERARYQGYFLAVFGASAVLGPVLGGLFAGQDVIAGITGWRWVFLVNVPIGVLALAVVWKVLNLPKVRHPDVRIDWWGTVALVVGVVPLLIVAELGRGWGWGSGPAIACYAVGAVGVLAFILVERRMRDMAVLPLRMFRNSTFALGIAISAVVGAATFGVIALLPQYLQVVHGSSPTLAGMQMMPMVLGSGAGSILTGQLIARTGRYRVFTLAGAVMLTVGAFMLYVVDADSPLTVAMVAMALIGLGLGNVTQPLTLAIQNALPPQDMGVSSASATFFRQIGGTLGVAVFLSILFAQMTPNITGELQSAGADSAFRQAVAENVHSSNPVDTAFATGLANGDTSVAGEVLQDSSVIQQLSPALAQPFKAGFADSMSTVFLGVTVLSLIGLVLVLFWKEVPLRTGGGLAAIAADRARAAAAADTD